MDFELGGVLIQAGFPLDVTLLCVGLVAGYAGLVRRHGQLMTPRAGQRPVTTRQVVFFTSGVVLFWVVDGWPVAAVSEHPAAAESWQIANRWADEAIEALAPLPDSVAKAALIEFAHAVVHRRG